MEIACNGTVAQLERVVAGMRNCIRGADETEAANVRHERRYISHGYDDDGSLVGSFRVDPEEAPTVVGALEAVEKVRSAERSTDDPETKRADNPAGARRVDAFVAIMESALAHELAERPGGDRYLTVVHIDAETLADDADGCCHVEDGPAIAPETARRLACDSGLVAMLDDENGNPLVVGKKTRTIPAALRRAVHAPDQGRCKFPGCGRPIAHIHHVEHFAKGGPTVLTNLVGVCKFHHRCVHEGGYTLTLAEDGSARFYRPAGQLIDPVPKAAIDPDDGGIERRNRDHGLKIAPDTVTTNWCGDTLDASLATSNIMWDRQRAKELDLDAPEEPSGEVWPPREE